MSRTMIANRLQKFGAETVWQEFTPLAKECNAVNLGQGFPDWPAPRFVKDAIINAVNADANQYCRSAGHIPLVQELANRFSTFLNRPIDADTQVAVGVGASETLFAIFQSFINEGDEVILISPSFDIYSAQVQMAGGVNKYVPLRLVDGKWVLDVNELRRAFTDRTKLLLINSPQNPTGKCFNEEEYAAIANILADFPNVNVICDEVYEHMIYRDTPQLRFANVPNMFERTLTVSSSGKTFSVTGWKVGWVVGPAELIKAIIITNQWVQFSVSTPAQQAIAECLRLADDPYEGFPSYYAWLKASYSKRRDILLEGLRLAGLNPSSPEGGFFIIADTSNIAIPDVYLNTPTKAAPIMYRDWAFCRFLTKEIGVAAIPPSAFFEGEDKVIAKDMARFAFCKQDDSLFEACRRLRKLRDFAIDPSKLPPLPQDI